MARPRLRALWRNVHLWIGLGLFLVLAPLGVTGSALVYDDQIDAVLHPQRHVASGPALLAPGAYVQAARHAFGERVPPAQLRLPQGPQGGPVIVQGGRLTAWLDPATGRVLDVGAPRQELRGLIHQLHGNLFMAQPGRKLVGWLGLFMLASCVSGLVIWWPRGGFVRGLAWRRSPTAWSNLHHMAGFWICLPLALLSFTGAAIAFPEIVRGVSGAPAPAPGARPGDTVLAEPRLTVDAAVAAALAAAGPGPVQQVALPAPGPRPAWRIQLRSVAGAVQVRVDDRTGAAEARPVPPAGPGGGDPLMRLLRQVHDGDDMGALWRAVIAAAGLAPALLGVTGTVLWMRRRRPTAQRAPEPAPAE